MSGAVTHFPAPTQFNYPWAIALGPDGNMWFTEGNNDKLGRITPTGTVTEYVLPKGGVPTASWRGPMATSGSPKPVPT